MTNSSGGLVYFVLMHRIGAGNACAGLDCIVCWDKWYRVESDLHILGQTLATQLLPTLTEAINNIVALWDDLTQPRYQQATVNEWQAAPYMRVGTGTGPRNRKERRKGIDYE